MTPRAFILAVTGCAFTGCAFLVAACGSYGTSVVEVRGNSRASVASVDVAVPLSLAAGQTARAIATPKDANGTALSDRPVLWYTSSGSIASVDGSGLISAIAPGTTVVSAVSEGVSGQATMAVVPTPIATLSVSVEPSAVLIGQTATATATLADSSGKPISGRTITWESSDISVATVDATGTVLAVGPGQSMIKASTTGKTNSSRLTVSAPAPIPVASVSVSPTTASLQVGASVQLSAVTFDLANNVLTGRVISWGSANAAIATVSSSGLVTAVAAGSVSITASSEGQTASSAITVNAPAPVPVASVSVSPASSSLQVGGTAQLSAVTRDANNNILTGRVISWSSSNQAVSTVSASGLVTAIGTGSATITALSETQTGTAAITVNAPAPVPVATVSVSPATSSLQIGGTVQLSAVTRDANNNVLTGRVITWNSSNTGISTVSASGLVTGVAAGSVTITASSETKSGTAAITVNAPAPAPVATVSVSPATSSLQVGATVQLSAVTRDANGNVLTGRVINWSSSNTSVATVSTSGLVSAIAVGPAQITAMSENQSGSATVDVQAPPPPPPPGTSNEPTGMTRITDRPFNALNELGWTDGGFTIAQDSTAPVSPRNVIRATFPTGWVAGSSPGLSYMSPFPSGVHTLYIRFSAKLSSNWYGQSSGFCKYFYVWSTSPNNEGFFFASKGADTQPLEPYSMLQGLIPSTSCPGGFCNKAPNLVPSARIIRGQWQVYEFILTGNSAGTADGAVDWYLDGVHVGHASGIQWTTTATVFNSFDFRPVWGGVGPPNVPATQTMDWDHLYLSGKN